MSAIPRAAAILSMALQLAPGPWCIICPEPCAAAAAEAECCTSECCCPTEAGAPDTTRGDSPCQCCASPTDPSPVPASLPPTSSKSERAGSTECLLLAALDLPPADSAVSAVPRDARLPLVPADRSLQSILCIWLT